MNRRGFLGGLAGILAAGTMPAIVRVESLMILPKSRAIIVPKNNLLTISMITSKALEILESQLLHADTVNRFYDDNNDNKAMRGHVINVRAPIRMIGYE